MTLPPEARLALLDIARRSLARGAQSGRPLDVGPLALEAPLIAPGASFVTLYVEGMLRGCIGSLEPHRPLAEDVAENAFGAGFRDPRFPPVQHGELGELAISITLVGSAQPVPARTEAELLETVRPGIDGLTLELGARRATFLPAVWEQLPEPRAFLQQLRRKAGLPRDFWSAELRFSRYQTLSFAEGEDERTGIAD